MAPAKRLRRRKSFARLSAEERKQIVQFLRDGGSLRNIAAAVGISKSTLYDWVTGPLKAELELARRAFEERERATSTPAKSAGEPAGAYVSPFPLSAQEQEQKVRALLGAGKAPDAIARELRVPLMYVKVIARIRGATASRPSSFST